MTRRRRRRRRKRRWQVVSVGKAELSTRFILLDDSTGRKVSKIKNLL